MMSEQSLVERLRIRAEIRRQIKDRKSVREGKPDRIADLLEEAAAEIERLSVPTEGYEHRKGGTYDSLGIGNVQSREPLADMDEVVIYRSREDGRLWARRRSEFEDGRFTAIVTQKVTVSAARK